MKPCIDYVSCTLRLACTLQHAPYSTPPGPCTLEGWPAQVNPPPTACRGPLPPA
eukprot:CAMPEP_0174718230 /NCGR_PEP_ID=MMETSP1094-20130205/28351_1 /TAXON_ID=156173 /ORGANISM="Chrysochromulina brevifilum, Strain UTEX LB 985" /LENGTH=53 /DNA_ID=CAMNT_0015918283 /DNA_START=320 /DNA_END=477 /DNA_ORIENTATION=-